ncbi:MAG: hypothetical protein L0229_15580 [Blastocatellia bacterium]|nr:hypothetical protein [Blastocatellia bacterium]
MKRIIIIPLILILFVSINSALIIESSSSASVAMRAQFRSFFSVNNIEVTEGTDPQAVFIVSLTYDGGLREFASSVNYATVNGTATSGSDYQQSTGTVNFPPGATPGGTVSMTVSIPIIDDSETEGDETFTLVLSNPSPAFDIQGPGTCTIHDNDSGPSGLTIQSTALVEGDTGTTDAVFRVELDRPSDTVISVDFNTENYSAIESSDYLRREGTVNIPAGQQSANIIVPVIGDTIPETGSLPGTDKKAGPLQAFLVRLSNARGAPIANDFAVGVIHDDDDPETITVCSSDTPKQNQMFERSSQIESVVRIDRDLMIDDMDVKLFISNQTDPFLGDLLLSAVLHSRGSLFNTRESLFNSLTLLPESTIGTRCSPVPDFTITDNAARRLKDHDGEVPYVGEWRPASSRGFYSEGSNARGEWRLEVTAGLADFDVRLALYTLEC